MRRTRARVTALFLLSVATSACALVAALDEHAAGTGTDGGSTSDSGNVTTDAALDGASPDAGPDAASLSPYAMAVLADDPLVYWRLSDDGTTAVDLGRARLDGTYVPRWAHVNGAIRGDQDKATTFDGGSVQTAPFGPDAALGFRQKSSFSIELWVRIHSLADAGNGPYMCLFETGTYGGDPIASGIVGYVDPYGTVAMIRAAHLPDAATQPSYVNAFHAIQIDAWGHVVFTYDGSGTPRQCAYFNGASADCKDAPGAADPPTASEYLRIARTPVGVLNPLIGELDDFAIYDRALDATTVARHFNAANR